MGWGLRKGGGDVTRGEAMIGFEICSSNEVQGSECTVAGGAIRVAVGGDIEGYERDETESDRSICRVCWNPMPADAVSIAWAWATVFDVEGWIGMAAGDSCQDTGEAQ